MKDKLFKIALKKSIVFVILGVLFAVAGVAGLISGEFISIVVLAMGVGILYFFALPLVNGGYMNDFNKKAQSAGVSMEQVEGDLANALHDKRYDLGQRFGLFYDTEPKLVVLRDLIWCYGVNTTTTHKLYGLIPVGKSKSYSVKLVSRDRSEVNVEMGKENEGTSLLQALKQRAPGVLVGYNEKIEQLARTDWHGLVNYVDEKNAGN